MKLAYLIQQLYSEPALITPEAHAAIRQLLEARLDDAVSFDPQAVQRQGEYCGKKVDLPSMTIENGLAQIPIGGAIGNKLSGFAKYAGAVDVQDVLADIEQAEADKKVKNVLFDIDSPGGAAVGTPELADRISAMKKPTFAFTDGLMASAAYWIGSATNRIFATRSAQLGSIGVYLPVFDYTKAFEMEGVKVELIKAGKLKGIGFPGTSLSDTAREHLQSRINAIYSSFKTHVLQKRGKVADETMQGQVFFAAEAIERHLADEIVSSKKPVVAQLSDRE